jgi:predicted Rossmann fold nucleotide-binding protein DprA/Smf involved in DNA uptake
MTPWASAALLDTWLSAGVSVDTLARLLEKPATTIEDALREELKRIQAEAGEAPAPVIQPVEEPVPIVPRRRTMDPAFTTHEVRVSAKAKRQETPAKPHPLQAYPKELQDPRATSTRRVYDHLREQCGTLGEIAERLGVEGDDPVRVVSNVLFRLRQKGLVENQSGVWRLTK